MSEAINAPVRKPSPAFLSPTPDFKEGGLLPESSADVLRNYRIQQAAYQPFEQKAMDEARAAGKV